MMSFFSETTLNNSKDEKIYNDIVNNELKDLFRENALTPHEDCCFNLTCPIQAWNEKSNKYFEFRHYVKEKID